MSDNATDQIFLNPAGALVSPVVAQTMAAYEIEQGEAAFAPDGAWVHASQSSATVVLETTERARVHLAGESAKGAAVRAEQADLHYLHVFHLTGLESGEQYALTGTATDRRGRRVESQSVEVRTVAPQQTDTALTSPSGERRSQADGPTPGGPVVLPEPLVLAEPGGSYVLGDDLLADGTAIRIAASDVTLDLNGHEVVYNRIPADREGEDLAALRGGEDEDDDEMVVGVEPGGWLPGGYGIEVAADLEGVRILNGRIRQGEGANAGADCTVGFNPIVAVRSKGLEIAGVTATYGGNQLSGIVCWESSEGAHLHHCRTVDEGRLIRNRHRMCCAIRLASVGDGHLHHNLVARTRQSALGNTGHGVHVHNNELHIDSHSINSFGIAVKDGSRVHDNRIFGWGDNAVGMVTTGGCRDVELYDNYIWLQAHDITEYLRHLNTKEMESAPYSIMSGVRITWGANEVTYRNNTILVTAREGGLVRGTFLYNEPKVHDCTFRDNLVVALAEDERSHCWGAIAGVGNETRGQVEPMLFSGNTIVSNFACFNLQDTYGVAINYHFVGNRFVRVGTRPGFATIRAREIRPSKGHVFRDNEWVDGADLDHLLLGPEDEFEVQQTRAVTVPPGAEVVVSDETGRQVWAGTADAEGMVRVPVTRFRQVGGERTRVGPYRVVARRGGEETDVVVER